ncbi:hypothetical protein BDR03DRAFT_977774 [Suillus americanus]|nr:hypothetical protein BDR03DRAFT_977774 [Suillus americanus]
MRQTGESSRVSAEGKASQTAYQIWTLNTSGIGAAPDILLCIVEEHHLRVKRGPCFSDFLQVILTNVETGYRIDVRNPKISQGVLCDGWHDNCAQLRHFWIAYETGTSRAKDASHGPGREEKSRSKSKFQGTDKLQATIVRSYATKFSAQSLASLASGPSRCMLGFVGRIGQGATIENIDVICIATNNGQLSFCWDLRHGPS